MAPNTSSSAANRSSILDMLLLVLSLSSLGAAQTWTNCDPLNTTCPPDPALSTNATFNFSSSTASSKVWNTTAGPINYGDEGMMLPIQDSTMAPTIQSIFYIFFGRVETIMKAASGQGIVSSVVLQSDDLDEIDWEFVGGNASSVQSNFYGKGDTSSYGRAQYHDLDYNPFDDFHNYTTVWTHESIEWWVDNKLRRTMTFDDPSGLTKNGTRYPQTPCTLRIGAWPAGRKGNAPGTIDWAGGLVDFSKGQTYTMTVQSVYVEDFSSGKEYVYGDRSGDWQSVKTVAGNSTAANYIWKPQGVRGHFNALSKGVQYGIIAGAIAVAAILAILLAFCCIKQRRAGRAEKKLADAEFEKGAAELMDYRRQMASGAFATSNVPITQERSSMMPSLKKSPTVNITEPGRPMKSGWL